MENLNQSTRAVLKPVVELSKKRREQVLKNESFNRGLCYIGMLLFCLIVWALVIFGVKKAFGAEACEVDQTHVIIHHTDSHDVSAKEIDRWHKERGFDEIGYHYILRADGSIEKGRNNCKHGAHAKGRNHYLGIAITGRDSFTPAQLDSLEKFLRQRKIRVVENHHRQCPGDGINLQRICKKLKIKFDYHN